MKTIARVLLLAVIPALTACGDDSSGPELDVEGTYELELVNNQPLPFVLQESTGFRAELMSAAITLNSNGTFTDVATVRTTEDGVITTETQPDGGVYTQNNNVVSLFYSGGGTINASVNNNTLTITGPGATFVFRR